MDRQKLILISSIAAGILLLLTALRPRTAREITLPDAYASDHHVVEEDSSRSARSGSSRISRLAASERTRAAAETSGTVRISRRSRSEDYESQKERAFGDSRIHGFVRGRDGKVLPGAAIELFENDPMTENPPLRTAVTDEEGSYTLDQLNDADRNYILVARAGGHAPEVHRVNMPRRPIRMDIRLSAGVPLAGVVRDALTSAPIAGATVYHPSRGEETFGLLGKVQTGSGGEFRFESVRKGPLRAQATAPGYRRAVQPVAAPSSEAEIEMTPGGAVLRGTTISRLTGKAVGGSKVVAESGRMLLTTLAKDDGTFEFADLPGGKYQLFALRGGVRSAETKIALGETETKEDVTITVPDDLFVSGKVERSGSGEPLPGVQVWFKGPRGTEFAMSDELGRFAFETLALDQYTLEVHEKNLLPVQDKRTSSAVETITRKVPPGASSDEVVIRLRSTRSVTGVVKMGRSNSRKEGRVWGADVVVDYKTRNFYERVRTRTDSKGNFFVNLPSGRPADVRVAASYRSLVDVESARAPTRQPIELELKQTYFRGRLVLSDSSPLSGVRIRTKNFLYRDKAPESNFPLPGTTIYTGSSGGFSLPVGEKQKIEVTFELPDEKVITKNFDTDKLLSRRSTFIYDPVSGDILTDIDRNNQRRNSQTKTGTQPQKGNGGQSARGQSPGRSQ